MAESNASSRATGDGVGMEVTSRASSTRRAASFSKCGPIQSTWRSGGDLMDSRIHGVNGTCGKAAPSDIDMRGPDGTVYPMTGTFQEIVEPERIVFISSALDETGNSLFDVRIP